MRQGEGDRHVGGILVVAKAIQVEGGGHEPGQKVPITAASSAKVTVTASRLRTTLPVPISVPSGYCLACYSRKRGENLASRITSALSGSPGKCQFERRSVIRLA